VWRAATRDSGIRTVKALTRSLASAAHGVNHTHTRRKGVCDEPAIFTRWCKRRLAIEQVEREVRAYAAATQGNQRAQPTIKYTASQCQGLINLIAR